MHTVHRVLVTSFLQKFDKVRFLTYRICGIPTQKVHGKMYVICDMILKESELHHSIGSLIDGAHPGPKTDRDYLGRYCSETFETAKGKKESGAAGNQTQGLWLKPPVLCH